MGRRQFSAPEQDDSNALTRLLKTREEVTDLILERIDAGEALLNRPVKSEKEFDKLAADAKVWSDYNAELLHSLFDTPRYAKEYSQFFSTVSRAGAFPEERAEYKKREINVYITRLRSMIERLPLIDMRGDSKQGAKKSRSSPSPISGRVFVVHGRNEAVRLAVTRFLEKMALSPVVLHEQPNAGRTLIEKFEDEANVGFTVVLLTPDDHGGLSETPTDFRPRARQNVILELGYFIGRLGRERVCCLYAPGVELPSDIFGLAYVPYDESGAWQLNLARELRAAGMEVDLNRILA